MEHRVSKHHEYRRQPIIEVVFELFAAMEPGTDSAWSHLSLPRITEHFPEFAFHEERLRDFGLDFQVGPDGLLKRTTHEPRERVRRWDEVRTQAIQFGPHMCAHNVLGAAYKHFPDHVPTIQRVLRAYLAEAKPDSLAWVGQRYVNRIRLPLAETDIASYFEIYPRLPAEFGGHRPLSIQLQTAAFRNGQVTVNLKFQEADDEHATYILDVYARSDDGPSRDADALINWHIEAHKAVSDSFELSVSQRSKTELFKELV